MAMAIAIAKELKTYFVLLRSAEIALENDFKYFIIIDKNNSNSYSTYTTLHPYNLPQAQKTFGL